MAEISKYHSSAVGRLLQHNNRTPDDGVIHSNEDIDLTRTAENYHFKQGSVDTWRDRLNHVYHMQRENLVTMAEVIVTLPEDVKRDDEKRFFKSVYEFLEGDFGRDNIINAVVHKDEITPHMHTDFIPTVPIKDKSDTFMQYVRDYEKYHGFSVTEAVNAKECLNREYFQKFHPRLLEYVTKELGYTCEILNGATDSGNRTVLQLKNQMLEKKIEYNNDRLTSLNKAMTVMTNQIENLGIDKNYFSATELLSRLHSVTTERDLLRQVIAQNNITVPENIMDNIMNMEDIFKENHFSISLNKELSENGILVIETGKSDKRHPMPTDVRHIVEKSDFLCDVINKKPQELTYVKNPENDKTYIIFPTEDIEDTLHNLIALKRDQRKIHRMGEKLIFPQITNDSLNISEGILRQCQFQTEYYLREKDDDDKERMMTRYRGLE